MGSPESDREFLCPKCGALLEAGADHCWMCRCEIGSAQAAEGSPFDPAGAAGGRPPLGWPQPPRPISAGGVLKTLGLVIVVLVAASVAFFATCWGGFAVGSAVPRTELGEALTVGLIAGGVGALAVAGWLVWLFWLRSSKRRRARR